LIQGVSAVITPMRSDPRRSIGMMSQGAQASLALDEGSSSQGLRMQSISSGLIRPQSEAAQSSGMLGTSTKAGVAAAQQQAPPKVEQKAVEPAKVATSAMMQTSSPVQEHVSQPLLPLPSTEQTQQATAQVRTTSLFMGLVQMLVEILDSYTACCFWFVRWTWLPSKSVGSLHVADFCLGCLCSFTRWE